MKLSILGSALALCLLILSFSVNADDSIQDMNTQVTFPKEISFDYNGKTYNLDATGVATRKKLFFKVYSIAHYLQKDAKPTNGTNVQKIMSDANAKIVIMKWVRDVDNKKMTETILETFHNVLSPEKFAQIEPEITSYIKIFDRSVSKGNEFTLRWIPGGHIQVIYNGNNVGEVTNKEFATALWSFWFGDKSVVYKNDLMSLMK